MKKRNYEIGGSKGKERKEERKKWSKNRNREK